MNVSLWLYIVLIASGAVCFLNAAAAIDDARTNGADYLWHFALMVAYAGIMLFAAGGIVSLAQH